jgi:hypothetical protein
MVSSNVSFNATTPRKLVDPATGARPPPALPRQKKLSGETFAVAMGLDRLKFREIRTYVRNRHLPSGRGYREL